jgi:hypothetical protein
VSALQAISFLNKLASGNTRLALLLHPAQQTQLALKISSSPHEPRKSQLMNYFSLLDRAVQSLLKHFAFHTRQPIHVEQTCLRCKLHLFSTSSIFSQQACIWKYQIGAVIAPGAADTTGPQNIFQST